MYNYDRRSRVAATKVALIGDGPIGQALQKGWNDIHDVEYDLELTMKDYDRAAMYVGHPGEKPARAMIKKIKDAVEELKKVSMGTLNDLIDAESDFIKKFGTPEDYARKVSDR